jgi:hypothetical protein
MIPKISVPSVPVGRESLIQNLLGNIPDLTPDEAKAYAKAGVLDALKQLKARMASVIISMYSVEIKDEQPFIAELHNLRSQYAIYHRALAEVE